MPTIYDIAKAAGVSAASVSRVLNGVKHPVSEATKQKILETAGRMNYRANNIAKSLSKGRTDTVAVLLPSITNDFYTQLVDLIEKGLGDDGYSTFLCNTHREIERETHFVGKLIEQHVDGVVFCPTRKSAADNEVNLENIRQLRAYKIAVVAIGSHFTEVPRVYVDTYKGAFDAAEYLISRGHRRIGYIDGLNAGTSRRRYRGYLAALHKNGLDIDEKLVACGDLSRESGEKCAGKLLGVSPAERPTAILTANNLMAVGVLREAARSGIPVPQKLSVIGFDDNPVSQLITPGLTVVRQPLEEIAAEVSRLLQNGLSGDLSATETRFEPELVLRGSCDIVYENNK